VNASHGGRVHVLELVKPDGRLLTLYSRRPIPTIDRAPSPNAEPIAANPHLRWHPLRGEWVAYAAHRQARTFLPPPEYNPLRPSADDAYPTELPVGDYDVAVFDNLFPSLSLAAHDPPQLRVPTEPALGSCEVVVFTQDPQASLASLPLAHVDLVLRVWADRTRRHADSGVLRYTLPFENRGVEVGVTLHHPHGQIYSYPFVPPVPARMNERERAHHASTGRVLLADLIAAEVEDGGRLLYAGAHAVAFVPAWARYPYEAWVAPRRSVPYLGELDPEERLDLARALKTVLLKYDGLWQRPFPYLMAWYQAPLDGRPHPEAHLHAEFLPPYRTRDKLKFLAGTELGAGMFAMDALPEDKARELQAVAVQLDG
jgi:UDPglucose--hexose-1-phosphate uridylyltransferase